MLRISRRTFLKSLSASGIGMALRSRMPELMAYPLGLPLGIQLYSVRDFLPKDYDGTLRQLSAIGYREVEAAGFFGRGAHEVKESMDRAGLRCVSAHYSLKDLLPKVDETIEYGKNLGLQYIVCASPWFKDPSSVKDAGSQAARDYMTLDDWRWNADQLNRIGERVHRAGMRFAYHNHTPEFRSENGVMFYDELLRQTDPAKVAMELDCGWVAVAGQKPVELLTRYAGRITMLHVKDFKMGHGVSPLPAPPSTELGHGVIDYRAVVETAKRANNIEHIFVEQEDFDMPAMEALKVDADYMRAFKD